MVRVNREYLRSTIFGIEDSLVSTTGLIAGLSVGSNNKKVVILGSLVAIGIEAISMGASEYLSDDAIQEIEKLKRHRDKPFVSGFLMFSSYLLAGFVPLTPVLILEYPTSLSFSIAFALVGLFLLGYIKGRLVNTPAFQGAFKILIVGGLATALGIVVGLIFKI